MYILEISIVLNEKTPYLTEGRHSSKPERAQQVTGLQQKHEDASSNPKNTQMSQLHGKYL